MALLAIKWPEQNRGKSTITCDNGSEFAEHKKLECDLGIPTFFCDPHSPWQRGSIENANGILRRDLPRKTELADDTEQDIQDIVWGNNTTPRKRLGFLPPPRPSYINSGVALEM